MCSSARNNPIATKISGDFGYIFSFAFRKYGLDTISRSTRKSTIWYYQNMNYPDFDRIACAILFLISRLCFSIAGNANRVGMNTVWHQKLNPIQVKKKIFIWGRALALSMLTNWNQVDYQTIHRLKKRSFCLTIHSLKHVETIISKDSATIVLDTVVREAFEHNCYWIVDCAKLVRYT